MINLRYVALGLRSATTSTATTTGPTPASATAPPPRSPPPGKIRRNYKPERPNPSTPTGSTSITPVSFLPQERTVDLEPTNPAVIITAIAGVGRLIFDWWKWRTDRRDRNGSGHPPDDTPTLAA